MRLRSIILFSLALLLITSKLSYSTDDVTTLTAGPVGLFFKGKRLSVRKIFLRRQQLYQLAEIPAGTFGQRFTLMKKKYLLLTTNLVMRILPNKPV